MNNEPVAWIDEETGCFVYSQYDYEDLDEHGKDGLIPLYTHPVKELTDEEIIKVNEDIGTCWDVPHRFAIQIARAILRKAQKNEHSNDDTDNNTPRRYQHQVMHND